jgi:ubiquinone/menaquinone biosynthesis C-methylase UbiE
MSNPIARAVRGFISFNRRFCKRVVPRLPQAQVDLFGAYDESAADFIAREENRRVVDIGGGKTCSFINGRAAPSARPWVVALDISEDEIGSNRDVDAKVVADVLEGLPFCDESVDLVTSRSVVEHIRDIRRLFSSSHRILRPGGHCIHLFPCKFAPFALINQMLPSRVSRALLYALIPQSRGICGFPAVYDRCYDSAIKALLAAEGFELVSLRLSYYQSGYFDFLVPLYLVSAAYEWIVSSLGVRNLAAYLLVVARKP